MNTIVEDLTEIHHSTGRCRGCASIPEGKSQTLVLFAAKFAPDVYEIELIAD